MFKQMFESNGDKFVSINFYLTGTFLCLQALEKCVLWRDKYFGDIQDLVGMHNELESEVSATKYEASASATNSEVRDISDLVGMHNELECEASATKK
ncbi:hypothetical protein SNE40_009754 [Patella caerulea]|uniref:Uncharacterized protein n=1 Tax=Patella caerulea TaxID=87958 RepID=A0AAN8PSL3_PATCE